MGSASTPPGCLVARWITALWWDMRARSVPRLSRPEPEGRCSRWRDAEVGCAAPVRRCDLATTSGRRPTVDPAGRRPPMPRGGIWWWAVRAWRSEISGKDYGPGKRGTGIATRRCNRARRMSVTGAKRRRHGGPGQVPRRPASKSSGGPSMPSSRVAMAAGHDIRQPPVGQSFHRGLRTTTNERARTELRLVRVGPPALVGLIRRLATLVMRPLGSVTDHRRLPGAAFARDVGRSIPVVTGPTTPTPRFGGRRDGHVRDESSAPLAFEGSRHAEGGP